MKNLQIGLEEITVSYLDRVAKEQNKTRSAVIREAVDYWIRQSTVDDFEKQWIAALKKENSGYVDDAEAWLAAETWGKP